MTRFGACAICYRLSFPGRMNDRVDDEQRAGDVGQQLQRRPSCVRILHAPVLADLVDGLAHAVRDAGASGTTPAEVLNLSDPGVTAKKHLDEDAYNAAWAEGYAMAPNRAVAYALADDDPAPIIP
jgi:hypothetical protein